MKYKIFILLIIATGVILNGCSLFKANKQNGLSPTPADGVMITVTSAPAAMPTVTPVPVITPSSAPGKATVTPEPTAIPQPSAKPSATAIPISDDPEASALNKAKDILNSMTLEEKVGQMFFVRCRQDKAAEDIKTYHLGGYILFADDFKDKTRKEVTGTISSYQKMSKIPLLIGVDEEGGTVNRISKYTEFRAVPFKSPQDLFNLGGYDLIISDTIEKARLLKSLGVNVNLAPVCDVSTDPKDFIYSRSFGKDAQETSEYVKTVVRTMKAEGIGSTLKHFPGYGNNVDTHTGISIDNRSYENFQENDFLPFQAGISAGAGSILVSHNIVTSMDKDYPASLSAKVHEILRKELGFQGVIMTDDLSMDAIKQYTDNKEAAVLAILAGNDLVIASDFDVQIPAVIAAVNDHTIKEDQIDAAVLRVLLWKLSLGSIS